MYTMLACGEQAGFVFYAFSFLYPPLSDVPHRRSPCFFFMFRRCSSVGLEVFAFSLSLSLSPSVLCVNLCYYEWAFCLVHLLHRTCWTVSQRNKTQKPEDIKEIKQRRKWCGGVYDWIHTETRNTNPQRNQSDPIRIIRSWKILSIRHEVVKKSTLLLDIWNIFTDFTSKTWLLFRDKDQICKSLAV